MIPCCVVLQIHEYLIAIFVKATILISPPAISVGIACLADCSITEKALLASSANRIVP
jgi:hypothetical protein